MCQMQYLEELPVHTPGRIVFKQATLSKDRAALTHAFSIARIHENKFRAERIRLGDETKRLIGTNTSSILMGD